MKQKMYNIRVLIGNEVIKSEQIEESLVSEYISSLRIFYKDEAMLLILDKDRPPIHNKEYLGSEDVHKIDIQAIPIARAT